MGSFRLRRRQNPTGTVADDFTNRLTNGRRRLQWQRAGTCTFCPGAALPPWPRWRRSPLRWREPRQRRECAYERAGFYPGWRRASVIFRPFRAARSYLGAFPRGLVRGPACGAPLLAARLRHCIRRPFLPARQRVADRSIIPPVLHGSVCGCHASHRRAGRRPSPPVPAAAFRAGGGALDAPTPFRYVVQRQSIARAAGNAK
jgi:hypothetical protein